MSNERRNRILEMIQSRPYVSFDDLEAEFPDVSSMTLRRDIDYFESTGDVIKVRGGARSTRFITNATDESLSTRMIENIEAKIAIAKKASEYLETGRSIFVDSGTTLQKIVPYIPNERYIFTATNPQIALDLSKIGQPIVNIVGGRLDRDYQTIYGPQAMKFLSEINIDIAFMSASGLSLRSGFTGGNENECEFKRAVVAKAQKVIVLLDSSKVGKSLPYTFCNIKDIDVIITDEKLPEDIVRLAKESGTEIVYSF